MKPVKLSKCYHTLISHKVDNSEDSSPLIWHIVAIIMRIIFSAKLKPMDKSKLQFAFACTIKIKVCSKILSWELAKTLLNSMDKKLIRIKLSSLLFRMEYKKWTARLWNYLRFLKANQICIFQSIMKRKWKSYFNILNKFSPIWIIMAG